MTTRQFLSYFPDHVIQTFDDSKQDCVQPWCGTKRWSDDVEKMLHAANDLGAGIFFSVNRFPGGRRKQELCAGVNAWFAECDTLSKEEQLRLIDASPLPPSMIVESKKSLHLYWLSNGTATKENFVNIQLGLAQYFHGDTAMKDIARVLRVPGFYHMKDPKDPFPVVLFRWHNFGHMPYYSEAQMLQAFPYTPPTPHTTQEHTAAHLPKAPEDETFWDIVSKIDNKTMLLYMSGTGIVNGEVITFEERGGGTEYIMVNGKMSDAWLDKNGMIGSGKGGGPTWIQWLRYYNLSYREIAEWVKGLLATL